MIRDQLGLPARWAPATLLPGLDMQALLDAVRLDVSGLKLGEAGDRRRHRRRSRSPGR